MLLHFLHFMMEHLERVETTEHVHDIVGDSILKLVILGGGLLSLLYLLSSNLLLAATMIGLLAFRLVLVYHRLWGIDKIK